MARFDRRPFTKAWNRGPELPPDSLADSRERQLHSGTEWKEQNQFNCSKRELRSSARKVRSSRELGELKSCVSCCSYATSQFLLLSPHHRLLSALHIFFIFFAGALRGHTHRRCRRRRCGDAEAKEVLRQFFELLRWNFLSHWGFLAGFLPVFQSFSLSFHLQFSFGVFV